MTSVTDDPKYDVVLCNFGGPRHEDEVEAFLRRLFEDPFIIRTRMPQALRGALARRIARKRAPKVMQEYQSFGFSPINLMTETQARHLETRLRTKHPNTKVHVCNRYTAPFSDEVVRNLDPRQSRLYLISLHPHLCHSTTVSSFREFDLALQRAYGRMDFPSTRVFSWWHHPRYLAMTLRQLQAAIEEALADGGDENLSVLFSAHGLPQRYFERGDPYVAETLGHFDILRRQGQAWLESWRDGRHAQRSSWHLTFQSRVGPVEWVRPYTDETIERLGKERGGRLVLFPISFTSDHIETLYEMDQTYRNLALAAGFTNVSRAIPANDDPELAECLMELLLQHGF